MGTYALLGLLCDPNRFEQQVTVVERQLDVLATLDGGVCRAEDDLRLAFTDIEPRQLTGSVGEPERCLHEREVGHGDHSRTRVSLRVTKGPDLLEGNRLRVADLVPEDTLRRFLQ